MPTFDGDNLIIILDPPTGGVLEVDVSADIYSDWKEWVKIGDNAKYPPAFRPDGGAPLTPGINQGSYFFIQNQLGWRIRPDESDHTVYVTDSLVPEDSSLPIVIPTVGAFTVMVLGLQPITQKVDALLEVQQETLYNGAVYVDTINGTPGTTFPVGTASEPAKTWAEATTIATALGLDSFFIRGSVALTSNCTNCRFHGLDISSSINIGSFDVSGSVFQDITVIGDFSSTTTPPSFTRCRFNSGVLNLWGIANNCSFSSSVTIGTGFLGLSNCTTAVGGSSALTFDLQGNIVSLVARNFSGSIAISNLSHAAAGVTLDTPIGRIVLNSSCTAGTATLNGFALLTDNSAGTTVNTDGLVKVDTTKAQINKIEKNAKLIPGTL